MFGAIGVGEAFGIAVAGAIPLTAAFGRSGELLPGWSWLALAGATVVLPRPLPVPARADSR